VVVLAEQGGQIFRCIDRHFLQGDHVWIQSTYRLADQPISRFRRSQSGLAGP